MATVGRTSRLDNIVVMVTNDSPDFFQFSWSLKNHMESEHEGKDVCCTHCNKMFANPVNLRKHLSQRICLGGLSGRVLTTAVKQVESRDVGSDHEDIQVVRLFLTGLFCGTL